MLTVCQGCEQFGEQPETQRQSPGRGGRGKWGSPIPWEEGPAAAGANELLQRGGNAGLAALAAPAGRLTAVGSNTGNTLGTGSLHPTPAWEAPGAKGSWDPREIPGGEEQLPLAAASCVHGDAVSHHRAGADGNAPLPASLQQLPWPPGSPSAGRALLQPRVAAPESRGPDSDPQTHRGCSVPKPRTNQPGCTFGAGLGFCRL